MVRVRRKSASGGYIASSRSAHSVNIRPEVSAPGNFLAAGEASLAAISLACPRRKGRFSQVRRTEASNWGDLLPNDSRQLEHLSPQVTYPSS
jgi:hypothetical protein